MQDPTLRHSHVQINNSFVHLLEYGSHEYSLIGPSRSNSPKVSKTSPNYRNFSSSIDKNNNTNISNGNLTQDSSLTNLIVFIPGNPGVLGVYHDFLASMFRALTTGSSSSDNSRSDKTVLLAISHNDFDHPDHVDYRTEKRIRVEENDLTFVERALAKRYLDNPHHIELQVLNKLIILKRLLNINIDECKLIFIGHSIGCYIILRLLQDVLISSAHEGSVLIHPALENMALTEKGSAYNLIFSYRLDLVFQSVAFIIDKILPKSAKISLTKWFCSPEFVRSSSNMALESVIQLACPKTLNATIAMAKSELALIKGINTESMIKPHASKLKLIYAIKDHWVNTENRIKLRESYPDLYMEEQPTMHAFVMDPLTVMDYAVKVGMFIQDFLENNTNEQMRAKIDGNRSNSRIKGKVY